MRANNRRKVFGDAVDLLMEDIEEKTAAGGLRMLPIKKIRPFHDHPFHLYEGERLEDMVASVREHGILNPVIVQEIDGGYEMLSGHNRMNAAKLVGLKEIPAIVKTDLSEEEAYVYVIETNLMQRSFSDLLISEKAAVLKARYEKESCQGRRNDIIEEIARMEGKELPATCGHGDQRLNTRDMIGKEYELSGSSVGRLLKLNDLIKPFKDIPDNAHWFSPPGFGMTEYCNLFSARQITMLTTFCDLLKEVQEKVVTDALMVGHSSDNKQLCDGGSGALAYAQAVCVYLAFVIDKMADRNTTVCTWNSSGGNPRATFGRQAIPMAWNYAEGNPFSTITGNFETSLRNIVATINKLPCGSQCSVYHGNATTIEFPQNVLICTEFPYYKNIGYAHLSDFFYIWLRRSLKSIFPELFDSIVTSKEELSTVGQYYGENQTKLEQKYRSDMDDILRKMFLSATKEYPSLLFFEYRKADEMSLYQNYESKDDMEGSVTVPSKPKKPCAYPGCPALVTGRYCAEHAKKVNSDYEKYGRDKNAKRRYGRAWKRIRDKYAAEHPFCEKCYERGVLVPVEEIHHKLPLSEGGTHDRSNLIALCKSCHSQIHAKRGDRWHDR